MSSIQMRQRGNCRGSSRAQQKALTPATSETGAVDWRTGLTGGWRVVRFAKRRDIEFFFMKIPSYKTLLIILVILVLYGIDQATKLYAIHTLGRVGAGIEIIEDFFWFVYVENTGAAWGIASGNNAFFIILSLAALTVMGWMAWKRKFEGWFMKTGATLLTAGILGNLTDRIWHGAVIDFLDFHFHWGNWNWDYPVFNVADMCIVGAAICFVLGSFFLPEEEQAAPAETGDSQSASAAGESTADDHPPASAPRQDREPEA
jgi:signal peptidase II